MFDHKTLLISGGTGSFGNAVCKKFLSTDIREIRIFSRDEKKQDDMRKSFSDSRLKFYLGDVRDSISVANAMSGVDFLFHAAALKQVPSCEFFPLEAVKTNILGTENVLNAAIAEGVGKIVCLSTDKAVYPINAMGMSKALMEKVIVAKSKSAITKNITICCTRYGNVMASRGSVIPLFLRQIIKDEPVTVTDPNMTRFMMTLEDAVELVLHAFREGQAGDIFVQKAPSATIAMLVEALQAISGKQASIKYIGVRHGEKQHEVLCSREDMLVAEDQGKYFRVPPDSRDLNYSRYVEEGNSSLSAVEEFSSGNTHIMGLDETLDCLRRLDFIREIEAGNLAVPEGI